MYSWVQSDMGNAAALRMGMAKAPVTVEESVEKMLGIVSPRCVFMFCLTWQLT